MAITLFHYLDILILNEKPSRHSSDHRILTQALYCQSNAFSDSFCELPMANIHWQCCFLSPVMNWISGILYSTIIFQTSIWNDLESLIMQLTPACSTGSKIWQIFWLLSKHLYAYLDQMPHSNVLCYFNQDMRDDVSNAWPQIFMFALNIRRWESMILFLQRANFLLLHNLEY